MISIRDFNGLLETTNNLKSSVRIFSDKSTSIAKDGKLHSSWQLGTHGANLG